jgi:hypothetical protein
MITSKTDLKTFVNETAGVPAALIEEISDISHFDLSKIERGLVMVFARWSPFPTLSETDAPDCSEHLGSGKL